MIKASTIRIGLLNICNVTKWLVAIRRFGGHLGVGESVKLRQNSQHRYDLLGYPISFRIGVGFRLHSDTVS